MYQQFHSTIKVAYLGLLFALLFLTACNTEEATSIPDPTEEPTAIAGLATNEPAEEPTVIPTEEPTAIPTEEPTLEPTVEPESTTAIYEEASCEFDVPEGRDVTCGWLTVPEDRNNPDDDSTIRLHVAKFASDSDKPAPDPIVYLAGGPGEEALEALPFTFELLYAPYLANHDFIMFDQRGTGYSDPSLACPEMRQMSFDLLEKDITAEEARDLSIESLIECRDRLVADGVNLAAYNSAASAADLNDLRLALGFDEWNLLGLSYGTRLAQTTMRDYPDGLRSVILDSTYPLEVDLLTDTSDNVARAYAKLFDGCAANKLCNEAYPELETTFFNLVEKHNEENIEITIADLLNGKMYDTTLAGDDLLGILFQTLYSTEIIPSLPQLITEIEGGDYATLSALLSSFLINGEFFSMGMQYSVQCNEENVFTDEAEVIAAAEKHPELSPLFVNSINFGPPALEVCDLWGAGSADAVENEAIRSDIPTLILAGEYDPITPPAWGRQVNSHLSNANMYEFPGTGHGVSSSGECAVELVESFLADPEGEPDASCLTTVTSPEFTTLGSSDEVITLVPFASRDFGIVGVVPEGWEETAPGVYGRGRSALDQTIIIQQASPEGGAERLLGILSSQLGWDEVPPSSGTYEAAAHTWTLYESEVQGFATTIGLAEEDGTTLLILLISSANEQERLMNAVFFPALDALMTE
ncbi:MAG: alpha/beta fold hydrolase [Ardenticatenaceae bacterium]